MLMYSLTYSSTLSLRPARRAAGDGSHAALMSEGSACRWSVGSPAKRANVRSSSSAGIRRIASVSRKRKLEALKPPASQPSTLAA